MRATILLCDYAAVADGKLTVVGAGWLYTGPDPSPSAVGLLINVPWDQTNKKHSYTLALKDADGMPVVTPDGSQVTLSQEFEAGRPPGHPVGTPITIPQAFNIGPLPLEAGSRYEWELTVDGEGREEWMVGFNVRPRMPQPAA